MRSWRAKVLVLIGVLSVVAAACGDDNGGETGGAGGTATGGTAGAECNADIKVGVAFDVGGLGDKSFNDAANAGLQQAIADGLVCEENVVTNEANATGSDRDQNVQALADAGFEPDRSASGSRSRRASTRSPPDYPDASFMIVDGYATCGTACGLDNDAMHPERRRLRLQGAGGFVPGRRGGGARSASATRSASSAGRPAR